MMTTLSAAVDAYVAYLVAENYAQTHVQSVKLRLNRFAQGRDVLVTAVTGDDIHDHFLAMKESGLADGTLAGHKSTHRAFWRWCKKRGLVGKNPAKVLKGKKHGYSFEPVHFQPADEDDFRLVVAALPDFAAHRGYRPRDVRDALIVSLTIDSGKRREEVWNIQRRKMEAALGRGRAVGGRTIYHVPSSGKTGAVDVRFFDETAELARRWLLMLPAAATYLLENPQTGERLRIDYIGSAFVRICAFANVPPFRFQATRKRNVIDISESAGDAKIAQRLAGHKSIRTTQAHYNMVADKRVDEAAAQLANERRGPRLSGENLADELFGRVADGEAP